MRRHKVSIIGAGMVGSTTAHCLAQKDIADIVLLDIKDGLAAGKGLDLFEASPINAFHGQIQGTTDFAQTKGSDLVVITAGLPRKPGMSRKELIGINGKIVVNAVKECINYSPEAKIIIVTNPVDALTYAAKKLVGLPHSQIMGMSGMLDSSRLRTFIAMELDVSPQDVKAMVIGAHTGSNMIPLLRLANVNTVPLPELLEQEKWPKIIDRTKNAGAEIVSLLQIGSAYYAPAEATTEMVDAILRDKKRLMPCSVCLEGEYGLSDCALCVPVILGKEGVEKVVEIKLTDEEMQEMVKGANVIKEMIECIEV
ncbi:malate dehydrogenase [Desulfohalobiaceae bacterium Ax17]|uniref:malate dehydrogenase n=1 Tax=Desulfovulcanus ferrireducens TaxID=2831190 RepID=UPI00207BB0D6|nr:malate dehydrogenase [Desulfovulcanus ferrireducens]MBT8764024.1 malate dehydrogenase [Desulfovulcanus ferrireducens]